MDQKKSCRYGANCYRKSLEHLRDYSHLSKTENDKRSIQKHGVTNFLKRQKNGDEENEVKAIKKQKFTSETEKEFEKYEAIMTKIFLVKPASDVFEFWKFCKFLSPESPKNAFESINIKLVGPFDVLSGDFGDDIEEYNNNSLCHWRFFYDIPEMQTFAVDAESQYHLAFYRDIPQDNTPLIVSNDGSKVIIGVADNIFTAFCIELNNRSKKYSNSKTLLQTLEKYCDKNGINYKIKTRLMERQKKINAPTLNKFGIFVQQQKKVGYRSLPVTDKQLEKNFESLNNCKNDEDRRKMPALSMIKRLTHEINLANDECDFGMGLELGLDLFSAGHEFFHRSCQHVLSLAYKLLKREEFGKILEAHLQNRRKGNHLSNF